MKQIIYWVLLLPLLFTSCSDDKQETSFISLNPTKVQFEHSGGSVKVKLTTNGIWETGNIPDWISLDNPRGNASTEIIITAKENKSSTPREAQIIFSQKDESSTLDVLQAPKALAWSSLSFSRFDNVDFVLGKNGVERIYNFTTSQLFINPDVNTGMSEKIFLGNLIDQNLEINTDVSEYKGYTFNPITVSASIGTEKAHTFIPAKSEQDAYANQILAKKPSQSEAFISDGKGVLFNSYRELNLIGVGNMGVNLDEVISKKSYEEQEMTKKNGLIYSFSHTLFTLNMDLQEHIVKEPIRKEDFPDNSISYISSVSYGRIGLLIVESDHDVTKVRTVIDKVLQPNANITQEDTDVLEELVAYHLYYNESQKLAMTEGKVDVVEAYKTQIADDIYTVFPFKFEISDYFERGETSMNFRITLP